MFGEGSVFENCFSLSKKILGIKNNNYEVIVHCKHGNFGVRDHIGV